MHLYQLFEKGFLPRAGGLYDQPISELILFEAIRLTIEAAKAMNTNANLETIHPTLRDIILEFENDIEELEDEYED